MKSMRHSQCGQGMTEYIIIVAMIAIAAIAVYQYFGKTVRNQTAAIAEELAGESAKAIEARSAAATASGKASSVANTDQTLDTYVGQKTK